MPPFQQTHTGNQIINSPGNHEDCELKFILTNMSQVKRFKECLLTLEVLWLEMSKYVLRIHISLNSVFTANTYFSQSSSSKIFAEWTPMFTETHSKCTIGWSDFVVLRYNHILSSFSVLVLNKSQWYFGYFQNPEVQIFEQCIWFQRCSYNSYILILLLSSNMDLCLHVYFCKIEMHSTDKVYMEIFMSGSHAPTCPSGFRAS